MSFTLGCFTLGCSTTSTVMRVNGPPLEGSIVGGSPDSIFVQDESEREYEIPRDDVSSIDYPGNVHTAVGAGVLGYGAINIAVGLPKCSERTDQQAAYCTGVFLPAAIGVGMIIWGLVVHHGQVSAAADTTRASSLPKRAPVPAPAVTVAPTAFVAPAAPAAPPPTATAAPVPDSAPAPAFSEPPPSTTPTRAFPP